MLRCEKKINYLGKEKMLSLLKREIVLIISLFLAIITSCISTPKLEYIDFKVLILLFNLMVIVAAFKELKVLDYIAVKVLEKCVTLRYVSMGLIFTTFITSMIVTNDVSLITFVPITIIIGKKINIKVLKTVVLQTIAANLGSSLTPMGNPQNLFMYTYYNINPVEFFKITVPIMLFGIIFLLGIILKEKNRTLEFELEHIEIKSKKKLAAFSLILAVIILSVFHVIDYKLAFYITGISVIILDRKLFFKVDYSLLITFVGFFIFVGNISNMNVVKTFMENMLNGKINTYIVGILSSQVISNVPATMLLSSFTNNYKELLLGTNIGGLGTLIASLASVISYKLYVNEYKCEATEYIKVFTIYNFIGLILFALIMLVNIL